MGKVTATRPEPADTGAASWSIIAAIVLASLTLLATGCHHTILLDTTPLDAAGMSYDSVQQVKSLNVTAAEVSNLAKARQGGLSDADCVRMLQIFRREGQPFTAGETVAGLMRAGIEGDTVVEMADLNQLGFAAGELEAMKLAGLSDDTILEVARRHAQGKVVLSGASLAGMKNAGLRDSTLLELSRRGIPDSQTAAIIALRRRGSNDQEILRHFTGS
jgi:hypothetical protein